MYNICPLQRIIINIGKANVLKNITTLYANPVLGELLQSREQDSLPSTTYVCIPTIYTVSVELN